MNNSFKDKIRAMILKTSNDPKRKRENIIAFIFILIVTIIIINYILNSDKKVKNDNLNENDSSLFNSKQNVNLADNGESNNLNINNNSNVTYNDNLEKKLENILNKINGVGNVNVLLTYSQSSEVVAMYNENSKNTTSEETDSEGGKRVTSSVDTSKEVICDGKDGNNTPVTQKVIKPKIEGAVVIAQGASNASVKTNIIQAVEAATGIATYKIQVFEMKND